MDKFAVISFPDDICKIIGNHFILKHVPEKFAVRWLKHLPTQISALIIDNENNSELGYILDVPGFFMEWDKLSPQIRKKHVLSLIKRLHGLDVTVLCFPAVDGFFSLEEKGLIEDKGIILLDGFRIRLCSLIYAVRTIFTIVKKDIPFFKAGIWGADNDVGSIWVEVLSDEVNEMCIGGKDIRALNVLSSKILQKTGLSCQVTDDPAICTRDKHIAVLTDAGGVLSVKQPSFNIISYRNCLNCSLPKQDNKGIFYMQSGWLKLPDDLSIDSKIKPWDELGIIEGLFATISKVYRHDILTGRLSLNQVNRIMTLFNLYPLILQGYMTIDGTTHFDRLRMDYYRNRRRNLFSSNIIS